MFYRVLCFSSLLIASLATPAWADDEASIDTDTHRKLMTAAQGEHRSLANRMRNEYRNPVQTLSFFGLQDDMTVVEISPGGGWYTEILAPVLRRRGQLYAAAYNPDSAVEYFQRSGTRYAEKLALSPEIYDKVQVTVFEPPSHLNIAPKGSADMVLAFRNLHGWMGDDVAQQVLKAIYDALKPGGVFGIVQHRGNGEKQDPKAEMGYVNQPYAIKLIEQAGFRLEASTELNANAMDTANHPEGVWTLPPVLELQDQDREKYLAIGESDRMTLRFVKPR